MAEQDFNGRVALITGGGSGIGATAARGFSARGARVVVADLNATAAARVAGEIGPGARGEGLDVTDPASVQALFARLAADGIVPDVLVNCAGIREIVHPLDLSFEEWNRILAVNVTGSFLVAQAFARELRDLGRRGAIVNLGSTSGILATESRAAYVTSKHAVAGLTKQLSLDLGPLGIRVNAVAPGVTRTPLTENVFFDDPDFSRKLAHLYPLGRAGEPEDVAAAILFLASDAADYITGTILPVDGGYTAGRKK